MTARDRYVVALRMTNKARNSFEEAVKDTTLLASLLLDLSEKITNSKARNAKAWKSHVDGALALVTLRGLSRYQDPAALRVLVRLSTNYLISCVASSSPVPAELIALRPYVGHYLGTQDPKWQLSSLMVIYANLLSDVRIAIIIESECIARCQKLDLYLRSLDLDIPPAWQSSPNFRNDWSKRAFGLHFDSYADRNVIQARNVLRSVRILLNEPLIGLHFAIALHEKTTSSMNVAYDNIGMLAGEICASVPQYLDCNGPAQRKLTAADTSKTCHHPHTPNHILDCYTHIFSL